MFNNRIKVSNIRTPIGAMLIAICASCSNSDSNSDNSSGNSYSDAEGFTKLAWIAVLDSTASSTIDTPYIELKTLELQSPTTVSKVRSLVDTHINRSKGMCVPQSDLGIDYDDPFGLGEARQIDAGEVITMQYSGNSYAELIFDDKSYVASPDFSASMKGPVPGIMKMSIPGGEFPAIESITIPTVNSIGFVEKESYSSGDLLSWSNTLDNGQPIWITTTDTNSDTVITCFADDNGSFSLPENIGEVEQIELYRLTYSVTSQNNAIVLVTNDSGWVHKLD